MKRLEYLIAVNPFGPELNLTVLLLEENRSFNCNHFLERPQRERTNTHICTCFSLSDYRFTPTNTDVHEILAAGAYGHHGVTLSIEEGFPLKTKVEFYRRQPTETKHLIRF